MQFDLDRSIKILERTPQVLDALLRNLPDEWIQAIEGPDTWSPFDIVGHLIHGETTDWIPRLKIVLADSGNKTFEPFDRFAQYEASKGKSMGELISNFRALRSKNIATLKSMRISNSDLEKKAIHPALGKVSLRQLLATWTVHDLNHIQQIVRVMAKQYKQEVGPWIEYLKVLKI